MSHPGLTKYMKKNTKYYDQGVTKLCHFVYIPYITHLICIYCTQYHLLYLAYAALYHQIGRAHV